MQCREEKVKEEKARYFAQLRQSLRNAFAEQAKLEAEMFGAGIVSVSKGPVADTLAGLDAGAAPNPPNLAASGVSTVSDS